MAVAKFIFCCRFHQCSAWRQSYLLLRVRHCSPGSAGPVVPLLSSLHCWVNLVVVTLILLSQFRLWWMYFILPFVYYRHVSIKVNYHLQPKFLFQLFEGAADFGIVGMTELIRASLVPIIFTDFRTGFLMACSTDQAPWFHYIYVINSSYSVDFKDHGSNTIFPCYETGWFTTSLHIYGVLRRSFMPCLLLGSSFVANFDDAIMLGVNGISCFVYVTDVPGVSGPVVPLPSSLHCWDGYGYILHCCS